jgi:hypothetical protein
MTCSIILAASKLGHLDRGRLAEFTELPRDLIDEFAGRLVENEVWMPDGRIDRTWQDDESGIEFWLQVNVATGDMERHRDGGEYAYRMTEMGSARYEDAAVAMVKEGVLKSYH